MSMYRRLVCAAFCASLPVSTLLLTGCSGSTSSTAASTHLTATNLAKGNWQINSSAVSAARLSTLSGNLTTQADAVTGTLHTQSSSACVSPTAAFEVSGSVNEKNVVTLSGPLAGGTLTLTGTLSPDGNSLEDASYNVAGGSCAFTRIAPAAAQAFSPITGNYAGNFADSDGRVAQVTANFSQSTTPDADGNFILAGTATVSDNPCFPTTVPISNTQVTGGTFTFTYTYQGSSVTANGTFSADASTLNVTNWVSSGTCGADAGVASTMTRQSS